ncbi:Holliday junction DNA helicase RuvA [Rickettsiella grylli]|uniref:Holliday junction branch migration protein RuvA n=1 Tax=Rickettsiella grylli TaxID=59196 RepID=UPI0008FD5766|nr:Holliday junction branch migration protein RuvA [Rickettsiella grylli]OJA00922.1 Holliday junction DNA helicase RuvA [Rickettsiella grylli]
MINRLRGILVEKQPPILLVEVANAFTYEIQASMHTFYQLPHCGEKVFLYTQFIVREDGHFLYGFSTPEERFLFTQLLKVSGVGPKVALGILSKIEVTEFVSCVEQQNVNSLQAVPGIGKKTAERLIIEMRDRLRNLSHNQPEILDKNTIQSLKHIQQDAIAALMALGYKNQEASRAVLRIKDDSLSLEALIRHALNTIN